ncbi:hypothetical protein ACED56_06505 [Vibrio splendidus]|uniref:hypothetical protein n=1 Tax=Vibrio splendidus TaxID=29497 RepID=UPI00352FC4B8
MKKIGDFSGKVWHRHFTEDSFFNLDRDTKSVRVITYSPINSFFSTYKFILDKLTSKPEFVTIVFGISDLNTEGAINKIRDQIEKIKIHANNQRFRLDVYLHTRCHVKMFSADDVIYIGSQNIATTSLPLSELKSRNYNKLFSYHELMVELSDKNQEMSTEILNNVIDDKCNCYKAIFNGKEVNIDFERLCYWNDYRSILTHVNSIESIKEKVDYFSCEIDEYDFISEIDISVSSEILDDIIDIYQSRESNELVSKVVDFICYLQDFDAYNLIYGKMTDLISEVEESMSFSQIKENLDDILDLEFKDLPKDVLLDIANKIISIIEDNYSSSKEEIVEHNQHDIVNEISANIGNYELWQYSDNDGNISEDAIIEAIYNKDISLESQVFAMRKEIGNIAFSILEVAMEELITEYQDRLDISLGFLSEKINKESAIF